MNIKSQTFCKLLVINEIPMHQKFDLSLSPKGNCISPSFLSMHACELF